MNTKTKVIFFGTPVFSVPTLKALTKAGFDIVLVITQPDQPVGRSSRPVPSPVKEEALALGLKVAEEINAEQIKKLGAEVGVVVAYGKIIPQEILDLFPKGCLNIHPSLLPAYRGPAPIQTAILNGDKKTGVSVIKLDEQMDHGPIISSIEYSIASDDTYSSLSEKLSQAGAELLVKSLPSYLTGKLYPLSQDDKLASFTKIINKTDGQITWQNDAKKISQQIRAYTPWPGCFSEMDIKGKKMNVKINEAQVYENVETQNFMSLTDKNIGQFLMVDNQLLIFCGHGALVIKKIQPEGKKVMTAAEFINGYLR